MKYAHEKLYLTTALNSSLLELEKICLSHQHEIEYWFRQKWHNYIPPFYASVDLRNSGYKIAPVDLNLFPGGFNNINHDFIPLAVYAINNILDKDCPNAKKILIIPENHTRNIAYLKNLHTLEFILKEAGLEVMIGSLSPEITIITTINIASNIDITYYPIIRGIDNRIKTINGFDPCLILLNNDLSAGLPTILVNIQQKLLPPLNAGWYMRKKSNFFHEYNVVCDEFAQIIDVDSWKINPYYDVVDNLDFTTGVGVNSLIQKVDALLLKIKQKYNEYNIDSIPYVIIKANNGTYGMGIMSIKSSDEIVSINRKNKNKMNIIKDGQKVNSVIIQEGVYTIEKIANSIAEPVIYMLHSAVIGGFYRTHDKKHDDENLNAIGAKFMPLSFAQCLPDNNKNRFYTYTVIARLSLLASSYELLNYK